MKKFFEAGIEQEERLSMLDIENLELVIESGLQMVVADCMGTVGLKEHYEVVDGTVYIERTDGYLDANQSELVEELAERLELDYTDVLETLQDLMEEGANKC